MSADPAKFEAGLVYASESIAIDRNNCVDFLTFTRACLARHVKGDWGDLDDHDRAANEAALIHGDRLLSSFHLPKELAGISDRDDRLWIITDGDRTSTTLLWPSEY